MKKLFISLEDPDLAYLVEDTAEFDAYIADMLWAQDYARANREAMMDAVLSELWTFVGTDSGPYDEIGHEVRRINCHHNYTEREHHHGQNVWLTRKGAIRARADDLGVIPGSMGTSSYVVRGLDVYKRQVLLRHEYVLAESEHRGQGDSDRRAAELPPAVLHHVGLLLETQEDGVPVPDDRVRLISCLLYTSRCV